jgi:PAS domain S-box-containing protein
MAQQISPRSDLAGQPLPPRPDDAPRRWPDALADQGPASIIIDVAGKLLFANAAYQALAQSIDSNLGGEVGEAAIIPHKLLLRVLNGEGPLEHRQLHKNSHGIVATRSRYWLLPGENGHGQEIAGNIFDESREVDALRIGRQARARFDDIARLTSDWVWEVNELFAFTFVSSRVADVLGAPAQALLGKNLFESGQFDGFEEANRGDHPKPDSRIPFGDIAYRMKVVDGKSRLFELSGVPIFDDRSGRFMGYRGTARDITPRIEAEDRATQAQLHLVNAVESMPQGFVLRDSQDKILLCNSHFEEIISPNGDMIPPGTNYCALIRDAAEQGIFDDAHGQLDGFIAERLVHDKLAAQETEFQLADGRWMQLISEMTEDGGVIETWIDITRMKERESELLEAESIARHGREQAEYASRTKSEFLANISHELRTPLNAIIGFSEIIRDEVLGPLGNEQYNSYAVDIHDSGIHLLGLINDILDYSKAEAGKIKLNSQPIGLAALIEACLRLLAPRANETGIALEAKVPEDFPKISADPIRLKQIILNLMSNGVKFTEVGSVTVEAEIDPQEGIVICVRNTGIGIAEDDIDEAFSLFGQVDSALSRKFEGTGLGLPLSLSLAQLHGGDLKLESEPGVGTRAIITLPAERIIEA